VAVLFVPRPIASLTLCVAICCIPTSTTVLHRGSTCAVAAIAGAHHILRSDKYITAEVRCNCHLLVILQQNAIFSGGFVGKTIDTGKFSIVRCIAESLKTHEVFIFESDHRNVEIYVKCAQCLHACLLEQIRPLGSLAVWIFCAFKMAMITNFAIRRIGTLFLVLMMRMRPQKPTNCVEMHDQMEQPKAQAQGARMAGESVH
jgi:hypothetical protein